MSKRYVRRLSSIIPREYYQCRSTYKNNIALATELELSLAEQSGSYAPSFLSMGSLDREIEESGRNLRIAFEQAIGLRPQPSAKKLKKTGPRKECGLVDMV